LQSLKDDPQKLWEMRVNAQNSIQGKFAAEGMVEGYHQIIKQVQKELLSGSYVRPQALTSQSRFLDISPPSNYGTGVTDSTCTYSNWKIERALRGMGQTESGSKRKNR
jgi:hypothetical protein